MFDINALPDDAQSLKRLLLEQHAAGLAKDVRLREKDQQIEHLEFLIAKLRRARFGQLLSRLRIGACQWYQILHRRMRTQGA